MRALYARDHPRRGYPGRPLVVGESGNQRVRLALRPGEGRAAEQGQCRAGRGAVSGVLDVTEDLALRSIESEAIHVLREVAAEFRNPALLFSGGKDSATILHLAYKAFWPSPIPFTLLHVD